MRVFGKPDLKYFRLMLLSGLICATFGSALAWLDYASTRRAEERNGWVSGQALLYEVGIRWSKAGPSPIYDMTVRYVLRVDGRDYEGSEIGSGFRSKSAVEVRSLIVPFAAEAAAYSFEDLGVLNPQRTWNVAYRPVPARYDPLHPASSQMVLDTPVLIEGVPRWLIRGSALLFLLAAAVLWIFARPAAGERGHGKQE
jgi:hypothetical protein